MPGESEPNQSEIEIMIRKLVNSEKLKILVILWNLQNAFLFKENSNRFLFADYFNKLSLIGKSEPNLFPLVSNAS